MRFAIIGAGMSGILAAIKLREAGYDDFALYERAARLGGTWRENTYPGIACDVPSHLYSDSFEPNPDWSHHFSPGDEIYRYFEGVARKHGVESRIRFGAEVVRCEWRGGRWQLETANGLRDAVDVVIAATGVLHHPNVPDFPDAASSTARAGTTRRGFARCSSCRPRRSARSRTTSRPSCASRCRARSTAPGALGLRDHGVEVKTDKSGRSYYALYCLKE